MPAASRNGATEATAFVAMQSLPIPIPWIEGAAATYDLIRVLDVSTRHDVLAEAYLAEEARIEEAGAALADVPADEAAPRRAALEAEARANGEAYQQFLLDYTRCTVTGINPQPVAGHPDTWAHLHPRLRAWLAQQGRAAAEAQMAAPLRTLTGRG